MKKILIAVGITILSMAWMVCSKTGSQLAFAEGEMESTVTDPTTPLPELEQNNINLQEDTRPVGTGGPVSGEAAAEGDPSILPGD